MISRSRSLAGKSWAGTGAAAAFKTLKDSFAEEWKGTGSRMLEDVEEDWLPQPESEKESDKKEDHRKRKNRRERRRKQDVGENAG